MLFLDDDPLVVATFRYTFYEGFSIGTWNHVIVLIVHEESRNIAFACHSLKLNLKRIERMTCKGFFEDIDC